MRIIGLTTLAGLAGFACVSATALSIDPAYSTFGTLSGATFGGTGIPNNAVAITTINDNNRSFTLGLTATPRYSNPAPVNDGAGTFWAVSGGDVDHNKPGYARWNVGYYVGIDPNLSWGSGYSLRLYYDKNAAVDNDVNTYIPLSETQNSQNLGMTWPFYQGSFNPNATGEYSFALVLLKGDTELGRSAINVNVNETGKRPPTNVPDGGSSLVLLGIALTGLGSIARFRK
jgi:hypothetical protein